MNNELSQRWKHTMYLTLIQHQKLSTSKEPVVQICNSRTVQPKTWATLYLKYWRCWLTVSYIGSTVLYKHRVHCVKRALCVYLIISLKTLCILQICFQWSLCIFIINIWRGYNGQGQRQILCISIKNLMTNSFLEHMGK